MGEGRHGEGAGLKATLGAIQTKGNKLRALGFIPALSTLVGVNKDEGRFESLVATSGFSWVGRRVASGKDRH